jgi:hypothetical protein
MKFFYATATLLLMVCSLVMANDEPVPGHTLMSDLPEGSRILIKDNIAVDEPNYSKAGFGKILQGKRSRLIFLNSKAARFFKARDVHFIKHVNPNSGLGILELVLEDSGEVSYISLSYNIIDGEFPKTVNDFNNSVGDYFQIIYDDPDSYPGMEESMVVDIVMNKITESLKANQHAKALPHFAFLEKQNVPLPESFYYYHTETLEKTGKKIEARVHAINYLKKYGKKGKYYAQVLGIMSRL